MVNAVKIGNSVNGDISTARVSEMCRLESSDGVTPTLKYKRRAVSANREFPQGCGRSGSKTDAHVELDCAKLAGSSDEPGTLNVDKSKVLASLPSLKSLIYETVESLESLDKPEALERMKIVESPNVLDETGLENLAKSLEPENSDILKTDSLVSTKNLDAPASTNLLENASKLEENESFVPMKNFDVHVSTGLLENISESKEKEFLPLQSTRNMVLEDLPVQLKNSDTQMTILVEAVEGSMHRNYPPRRRVSAYRDFPRGCGRNAPCLLGEQNQISVVPSKERSLVNEKEQIAGGDAKQMREKAWNENPPKSNVKGKITKQSEDEVRIKSDREVKKETNEHIHLRVASQSKLKREDTIGNSSRPPRESNMPRSGLKPLSSGKRTDRDVGSSGGKSADESAKSRTDTNPKRKFPGKSVDEGRAINQSQVNENVGLGSLNERVIVQGLMAASNCPWRQGKLTFKSPGSFMPSTGRSKSKKNKAKNSERKSTKRKMSPIRKVAHDGGSELVFKDEDDFLGNEDDFLGNEDDIPGNEDDFPGNEDKDDNSAIVKKSQSTSQSMMPFGVNSSADKDDGSDGVVTRKKVRETLRLFQAVVRKLTQEEESKSKTGQVRVRFDLNAGHILKKREKWVNTGKPILGSVPGVEVGDEFRFRVELAIIGLHRPFQSGIDYISGENMVATSIVASGGYADEMDNSDVLKYSGQGGNPAGADKKPEDQKLVRGNLALKKSCERHTPVRVIRGFKEKGSDSRDSRGKISTTYTYDGLYLVETFWDEKGRHGNKVYMFQLRRIPGQPELAFKEVKKSEKAKVREGLCEADISQGKEKIKICAINTIDNEKPPPFKYITNMIYPSWYNCSPPKGCGCTTACSDSEKCSCAVKNGGELPFNYDGAIVEAKRLVYECGPSCKCPPSCHNRVSQQGIKFPLEIFKTDGRGWGVRSRASIPSGSFICEYTGELLKDTEAEERTRNDEYLFDIGNNYNDSLLEGLSNVLPSDSKTSSSSEKVEDVRLSNITPYDLKASPSSESVEDVGFTIDAAEYGSVGRFVNHSCSPNLYAQDVLYDHDDKRMPHIMLFAAENIPPLQELTYHYNYQLDKVFDFDGNIKKKACYCGSVECTGRMY